jgi:sortase A
MIGHVPRHGMNDERRNMSETDDTGESFGWRMLGLAAKLLLALSAVCALYVVWQTWWTGVQSRHVQSVQSQSSGWTMPEGETRVAMPQAGEPPVQPETAAHADLIAQVYIPRFGDRWERNVVQGTDMEQLNRQGMGHYETSQMPGQVGNTAYAGHRGGYGSPLGDIDKIQDGDAIILRTRDYWYVYHASGHEIVTPDRVDTVSSNPENPGTPATKRMLTLTSCDPKYSAPAPRRWITHAVLGYWARASDGIPAELARQDTSGKVTFTNHASDDKGVGTLKPVILILCGLYAVMFLSAALLWRWPAMRDGHGRHLSWLQPGPLPVRILLTTILALAVAAALFEWVFPWAAANIPVLQQMSGYVAGGGTV